MDVLPLHPEIVSYLKSRKLEKKLAKQAAIFTENTFHPSLRTELLEPRYLGFWSFRVDKKYRAIFIFRTKDSIEIIDVNNHYR